MSHEGLLRSNALAGLLGGLLESSPMKPESENTSVDDVVDIEEFFVSGRQVPAGRKYRIRIDKQRYVVDVSHMTGRQILTLAGKTPEKSLLRQKVHGSVVAVGPDDDVSFLAPGVERFMTIPNEVQEGEPSPPRMHFQPLPTDIAYLNSLGLRWEAILEAGARAVVLYRWPLPTGYTTPVVDVHVRLTDGYPDTQIDMAYFAPALGRIDGRAIRGLSTLQFDGRQWQQWSRHRTGTGAWRVGEDDLSTHMALVHAWLSAELRK